MVSIGTYHALPNRLRKDISSMIHAYQNIHESQRNKTQKMRHEFNVSTTVLDDETVIVNDNSKRSRHHHKARQIPSKLSDR